MTRRHYMQDPDAAFDNIECLEKFDAEIVQPQLKTALLKREISTPEEVRTYETKLWDGYLEWLGKEREYYELHFLGDV